MGEFMISLSAEFLGALIGTERSPAILEMCRGVGGPS